MKSYFYHLETLEDLSRNKIRKHLKKLRTIANGLLIWQQKFSACSCAVLENRTLSRNKISNTIPFQIWSINFITISSLYLFKSQFPKVPEGKIKIKIKNKKTRKNYVLFSFLQFWVESFQRAAQHLPILDFLIGF